MRSKTPAPVDTMGCATNWDSSVDAKTGRFHTLVSLMLSSQTKDEMVAATMKKLLAHEHGLTPQSIVDIGEEELNALIYSVGFRNKKVFFTAQTLDSLTKVQYLKDTARVLIDKYGSDIPPTVEQMCELPGVGKYWIGLHKKS